MPIKVRVRDFQSIEDATIVIDGLTVITGTNNAGKSAMFRAFRGALTNARGYDFVRYGAKHCTVDVEDLETNRTLTWKKGKGINTYVVDGKELPKVGVGVPPEAQIFGVESVRAGNSEMWPQIAEQLTGVSFLLHESGSVVAEAVADVDRVNQLSRALSACDKDKRSTRSNLKVRRKDAKTFAERMEGFAGLDEASQAVDALEKRHKKAQKIAKANANLVRLGERVQRAKAEVEGLKGLDGVEVPSHDRVKKLREGAEECSAARRLRGRLQHAQTDVQALTGLEEAGSLIPSEDRVGYVQQFRQAIGVTVGYATRCEEARQEFVRAQKAQEALEGVSLDDDKLLHIQKFKQAIDNARRLRKRYVEHTDAVTMLEHQVQALGAELKKLTERASEVLGTYQECPTCGGNLEHVH